MIYKTPFKQLVLYKTKFLKIEQLITPEFLDYSHELRLLNPNFIVELWNYLLPKNKQNRSR